MKDEHVHGAAGLGALSSGRAGGTLGLNAGGAADFDRF